MYQVTRNVNQANVAYLGNAHLDHAGSSVVGTSHFRGTRSPIPLIPYWSVEIFSKQ